MAQTYSVETAGIDSVPVVKASAITSYAARLRRFRATINLASQASGDTVVLADIPAGFSFAYGVMTSGVSLGTATVSVGTAASPAYHKAAAVFTATDTPTMFGTQAAIDDPALASTTRLILTVGTAALPASGTLMVDLYFSDPN